MRRKVTNRNKVKPDVRYGSLKVAKFINHVMLHGKKNTATEIVYDAFDIIKEQEKVENPLEVFDTALKNAAPQMEIRSRRVGGATYQVPVEVRNERAQALAIRWIVGSSRKRNEKSMVERLAQEFVDANESKGASVKKKEDTHKMAEANRAFAHYRW